MKRVPCWRVVLPLLLFTSCSDDPSTTPPRPPARVTDLAAVTSLATPTSVRLTWTTPGMEGGEGKASEYDLRYALASITEESWDDAVRLQGLPAPGQAGQREAFTATGLEPATTYFFALRSVDDAGNWSELSNVLGASTASLLRLTSSRGPNGAYWTAWSPDGQSIVFSADWIRRGYSQLYLIPANGGEPVQLTDDPEGAFAPAWSPDGRRLAFVSRRTGNAEIWIMDPVPGTEPLQLTSLGHLNLNTPAWSPDGTRIAFVVTVSLSPPTSEIYTIPSAGGAPELLVGGPARNWRPSWSPDGTRIAFSSSRTGDFEIWVMPADGGEAVQLTNDPATDYLPAWSPDGNRIAFSSDRAGNMDLWVISSTGGSPTRLTSDAADEAAPSWSPDGSRIAFSSYWNQVFDIWVLYLKE